MDGHNPLKKLDKFEALRLIVPNVSRETFQRLLLYEKLLIEYNKKINLISRSSNEEIWVRHFLDSAQLFSLLNNLESSSIIDVGSGAGFPGMVLAILGLPSLTLLDSRHKRCDFLKNVSRETKTDVNIVWGRVETCSQKYAVIIARAVASITKFLDLTQNIRKKHSTIVLLKGGKSNDEIEEAKRKWHFTITMKNSITSSTGRVLVLNNIQPH